jgi:phenylacetate-CoA ligase
MNLKETIYRRLPYALQNLAIYLEGARIRRERYSTSFFQTLESLQKSREMTPSQLTQYQGERLSSFLKFAAKSPFWRERFQQVSLNVNGSDPFHELRKLPVLTKAEVKDNIDRIRILDPELGKIGKLSTSGTTGSGLSFPVTVQAQVEQWALWWRYRISNGIKFDTWCSYYAARMIVPQTQTKPPFWRYSTPTRQVLFSQFHMSPANIGSYIKAMQEMRFSWMHGYPSLLSTLANYWLNSNQSPPDFITHVTLGAENLLSHQSETIKKAFGVYPLQHYGLTEAVANISMFNAGPLTVDEDFSIVEFVPREDLPDNNYRIVGTNLSNPAFPLIRYDTNDVAYAPSSLVPDGTWRTIVSIDGRQEDFVILKNGLKLGRLDGILKKISDTSETQLVQSEAGQLLIRIVKGKNYSNSTEQAIRYEFHERIGNQLDITFEYVDRIPRTKGGKLRFVVSEIPTSPKQ